MRIVSTLLLFVIWVAAGGLTSTGCGGSNSSGADFGAGGRDPSTGSDASSGFGSQGDDGAVSGTFASSNTPPAPTCQNGTGWSCAVNTS
jgi:hypothetical protein